MLTFLFRCIAALPLSTLHAIGAALGRLVYWSSPTNRRRLSANLAQAGYADGELMHAAAAEARLVAVNDKGWIDDEDIPFEYHLEQMTADAVGQDSLLQQAVNTFERNFLLRSLEKCEWNVTATSRYLGIPLSTLKHKMGRLEVRELARRLRTR